MLKKIFVSGNRLRTWVRFTLFIIGSVIVMAIGGVITVGIAYLTGNFNEATLSGEIFTPKFALFQLLSVSLFSIGIFGLSIIFRRYLDKNRHPLKSIGFDFKRAPAAYLWGFILGMAILTVGYIPQMLFGFVEISYNGGWFAAPYYLILIIFMFIAGAFFEEVLLRGYPTKILDEATFRFFAIMIPSVIFGLMHLGNPGANWLTTINIILSGALLGVVYLKSGSLWLVAGLHFGWNFMQGPVFGMGVSGTGGYPVLFNAVPQGNEFFSGGDFGLEGSLIVTILIPVVTILFLLLKKFPLVDITKQNGEDSV